MTRKLIKQGKQKLNLKNSSIWSVHSLNSAKLFQFDEKTQKEGKLQKKLRKFELKLNWHPVGLNLSQCQLNFQFHNNIITEFVLVFAVRDNGRVQTAEKFVKTTEEEEFCYLNFDDAIWRKKLDFAKSRRIIPSRPGKRCLWSGFYSEYRWKKDA